MSKNHLNNYRTDYFEGYAEQIVSPLIKKASIYLFYPTGEENPVDTNTMNNQSIIARFSPYNSLREFEDDEDNYYPYFIGACNLDFSIAAVRKEDPYA